MNHHLQTVVFASALVSNEIEDTYVWILETFVETMKGKSPQSVRTDGDGAMRNVIRKFFPGAHHHLCGWHLLKNATSNGCRPKFTQDFKKCMLGDFEIDEFEERSASMVKKFRVEENTWVQDTYQRKEMWSTTYMKGKFFTRLRTTSRCEALHSQIGRYVQSGYNLREFL